MSDHPNSAVLRWLKRALPLVAAGLLAASCEHYGYDPYYGDTTYYDPYYASPGASIYVGPSYRRGYRRSTYRGDRRGVNRRVRGRNRNADTRRFAPNTTQFFTGPNATPCYINQSGNRQCIQGH